MKKSNKALKMLGSFCALAACAAIAVYVVSSMENTEKEAIVSTPTPTTSVTVEPSQTPVESEEPVEPLTAIEEMAISAETESLPHDKLFITPERQEYQSGALQLIIPKLEVDIPILNGIDDYTLSMGEGLYDYSQLPGKGNRNVSIAGHRNSVYNGQIIDNMPFYYIDTLADGDCLYLVDDEYIYRYVWDKTTIVEESDWGPIYSQGFSALTLTSCEPIGIADHRIIVRAAMVEMIPFSETYEYPEVYETEIETPADWEAAELEELASKLEAEESK